MEHAEVWAAVELQAAVPVAHDSDVGLVADVAHSWAGKGPDDLLRVVNGSVVQNEQIDVYTLLREDALQSQPQRLPTAAPENGDADARQSAHYAPSATLNATLPSPRITRRNFSLV